MIPWIPAAGLAALMLVVGWILGRRRGALARLRDGLFGGALPSAPAIRSERRPRPESWELRWAEVENLTAADLTGPPRSRARAARREVRDDATVPAK